MPRTTPLMMAALNNQVDCVRELLKVCSAFGVGFGPDPPFPSLVSSPPPPGDF